MTNITYATKSAARYADKREREARWGNADFPARIHLEEALAVADLELDADYAGTSHNPFMIEAFIAAIRAGNLAPFSQMPYKASAGRTAVVGERFNIDATRMERVFDATIAALTPMDDESRRYYLAAMFLSADLYSAEQTGTNKAGVYTIVNAVNLSKRYGINTLFSVNKMLALHKVYNTLLNSVSATQFNSSGYANKIELANKKLAFIAAFTVPEMERIMTEFTPDTYALPGRVKAGFGCQTLDEAIRLINTTHTSLLESMLPVL